MEIIIRFLEVLRPLFELVLDIVRNGFSLVPIILLYFIGSLLGLLALLSLLSKLKYTSKIEVKSSKQYDAKRRAIKAIREVRKASGAGEALDLIRKLNGFEFELFVLEVFAKTERRIKAFDRIKLTGDGGVDGAFLLGGVWYVVQSKHYQGVVKSNDISAIGVVANRYKTSTHPYAVKRRKKMGYKDVKALFVTSGGVASSGLDAAEKMGVRIIHLDELIAAVRKNRSLFA